MEPNTNWIPFREPVGRTLARNIAIALVVGAALAVWKHDVRLVLPFSALAMWFSLGGHYVEIIFLNGIRPRIPSARLTQLLARLAAWFAGGAILYLFMAATAHVLLTHPPRFGLWWSGGLFFIGVELIAHAVLALRGSSSFYGVGD
jgi:hypothetical protein